MKKIAVSDTVRAQYEAKAKEVWLENGKGTYGQDMDTITKLRLLRDILPAMTSRSKYPEQGELDDEVYGRLVQLMKLGSNAHAINVSLNELGGSKKTPLVADLTSIS